MSATEPSSDGPFGLQPNVAAGLAYLFGWLGGLIMLLGGGTSRFVKWSAAQSITFWVLWYLVLWVIHFLVAVSFGLLSLIWMIWSVIALAVWVWTTVTAFQGKEVRIPIIADITASIFKTGASTP